MRAITRKQIFLIGTGVLAPLLLLLWFVFQPQTDAAANLPLFHFYVVTFTTFSAAVISILLSVLLRDVARPRHFLAAVAFAVIGLIFFIHGFTTPGALIGYFHPAVSWSAWLTLFGGGVVFALAALDGPRGLPRWLTVRRVVYLVIAGLTLYLAVVLFAPYLLEWIDAHADPWHRSLIFYLTVGLWFFAALRLGRIWWTTGSRVDGVLAFVSLWMGYAAISMHQFPIWQLSWWLYHFILLIGFLVTVTVLLIEYEQVREFRLLHYYLAVSLIVTALMALIASYVFAQFSYSALVAQKETATVTFVTAMVNEVGETISADAAPADALQHYARLLPTYPMGEVFVYDRNGEIIESGNNSYGYDYGEGNAGGSTDNPLPPEYRAGYDQALSGVALAEIIPPATGEEAGYNPFGQFYTVMAYVPLFWEEDTLPVGAVITFQAAQDVNQAILQARTTGLIITSLSMGVLFGVLLLVVARADRIITARTRELALAYKNLRQAEAMRDDLTSMIVHDLRNPLSIVYGMLGLIKYLNGEEYAEKRTRQIDQALRASERMTGLIDDILAVSKIEAGQLKPSVQNTSVAQLLADHLEGFTVQAAEEQKQLTFNCPADLNIPLDPKMMGRVVDNLVSNALKYTEAGGQIQVTAWANNGQAHIRVRDNGEGISDVYKKHIFEKFAQAPAATEKPRRKGTGLGLAFCGLAVQLHNGDIWVEDAPGGGSDFIVRLPANGQPG